MQKLLSAHQSNALSVSSIGLSFVAPSGISRSTWVFDSDVTHHMTNDIFLFSYISAFSFPASVLTANGTPMSLAGIGSIVSPQLSLSDVYCLHQLTLNLISISQLCDSGHIVHFSSTSCHVQDPHSKKLIGTGRREEGLYILEKLQVPDFAASKLICRRLD